MKGIVELIKKGIFAAELIKKRRYWPRYVDSEMIKNHFLHKEVNAVDAIKGQFNDVTIEIHCQTIEIHCLKEPNYTIMLMSSYGTLELMDEEKEKNYQDNNQNIVKKMKYPELVYNHYQYRDSIDAHNSSRMFPIAMEETWKTTRWPCRVFVSCRRLQR